MMKEDHSLHTVIQKIKCWIRDEAPDLKIESELSAHLTGQ
jgi:hypothetical protein